MGHSIDIKTARLLQELNTALINYSQIFPKQKLDVSGGRESSLFFRPPSLWSIIFDVRFLVRKFSFGEHRDHIRKWLQC
jgi:hypothetical protein